MIKPGLKYSISISFFLFSLGVAMFVPIPVASQTKDVTIKYENINPTSITALVFGYQSGIDDFNPSLLLHNFSVSFNRNRFSFDISHSIPIVYLIQDKMQQIENSNVSVFNKTEVCMAIGLRALIRDDEIHIGWKQNLVKNWKIDVPVKMLVVKGLHFGGNTTNTFIEIDEKYYPIKSYSAFLGYFVGKYHNYEFWVDAKHRKGLRFNKSYLDIFYSEGEIGTFVRENSTILPLGARLGSQVYSLRHLGLGLKVEIGILPRNLSSDGTMLNFYGKAAIGVNLVTRKIGQPVVEIINE